MEDEFPLFTGKVRKVCRVYYLELRDDGTCIRKFGSELNLGGAPQKHRKKSEDFGGVKDSELSQKTTTLNHGKSVTVCVIIRKTSLIFGVDFCQ